MTSPIRQITEAGELLVEWVRRGDIIRVPQLDQIERVMVVSPCEGDLMHVFFCESCKANLANVYNLRLHLEKGGAHRIATWCPKRKVYEAIGRSEFIALQTELASIGVYMLRAQ